MAARSSLPGIHQPVPRQLLSCGQPPERPHLGDRIWTGAGTRRPHIIRMMSIDPDAHSGPRARPHALGARDVVHGRCGGTDSERRATHRNQALSATWTKYEVASGKLIAWDF